MAKDVNSMLMAVINSRLKPEWLDDLIPAYFRSSNDHFYMNYYGLFRQADSDHGMWETARSFQYHDHIKALIHLREYDDDRTPEETIYVLGVIRHSIIAINDLISTELYKKFEIEYSYPEWLEGSMPYIRELIRKNDTMRFDRLQKKRRVFRMQTKLASWRIDTYYNRITTSEVQGLGHINFYAQRRVLNAQLRIVSANSREFSDPKCDITPIVDVSYLEDGRVNRNSLKVCLESGNFYDQCGQSVSFENGHDLISRVRHLMEMKL